MSMPTYKCQLEDIMLPFLQTFADGKMHTLKELHVSLADHFALSDEERSQFLPLKYYRGCEEADFGRKPLIGGENTLCY